MRASKLSRPRRLLNTSSVPSGSRRSSQAPEQVESGSQLEWNIAQIPLFPDPTIHSSLPSALKSRIEHVSGLSLDDVHIHYHSTKPRQLNALAYTQGTEIYLEPGQEQHLPHEAWHVVQQKQGRVKPTIHARGVGINTDASLEAEATRFKTQTTHPLQGLQDPRRTMALKLRQCLPITGANANAPVQRVKGLKVGQKVTVNTTKGQVDGIIYDQSRNGSYYTIQINNKKIRVFEENVMPVGTKIPAVQPVISAPKATSTVEANPEKDESKATDSEVTFPVSTTVSDKPSKEEAESEKGEEEGQENETDYNEEVVPSSTTLSGESLTGMEQGSALAINSTTQPTGQDKGTGIEKVEERVAKQASHLKAIRTQAKDAFAEPDVREFEKARPLFAQRSKDFQGILSEKAAKAAGFSGVIHFGNNKSIKGTVGIVAKPHALKAFGGTQLTFANIQATQQILSKDQQLKKDVIYVRNVNNAPISVAELEISLRKNKLIYFHLNQFDQKIINAILKQDEQFKTSGGFNPVKRSVTAQELYHIYRNWGRFQGNVIFLRNLHPVKEPW